MASAQQSEAGNEIVPVAATNVLVDRAEVVSNDEPVVVRADEYRVGDLVWCKITHDPYWPGQVQDPKHATAYSLKHRPAEGYLFVTLFGDGSCAWCEPSQLEPFAQNFNRLSRAETARVFVRAVNEAVEEAVRVLDSSLTCACVSAPRSRPTVRNSGVIRGVPVPEADVAVRYEADDVLSRLTSYAKGGGSCDSALEVGGVRGWLSSFYRFKGVDRSQVYREPCTIEGLEDKGSSSAAEVAQRPDDMAARGSDKDGAADVLTPRLRKRSKYLSPPYTDWPLGSAFKKGPNRPKKMENGGEEEQKKREDVHNSGVGLVEEDDGMNITLSSLVPAKAAPDKANRDDTDALSELNAIRQKLDVTSVILERYHVEFTDKDKAGITEDMNNLMEEAETLCGRILSLAERTSIS